MSTSDVGRKPHNEYMREICDTIARRISYSLITDVFGIADIQRGTDTHKDGYFDLFGNGSRGQVRIGTQVKLEMNPDRMNRGAFRWPDIHIESRKQKDHAPLKSPVIHIVTPSLISYPLRVCVIPHTLVQSCPSREWVAKPCRPRNSQNKEVFCIDSFVPIIRNMYDPVLYETGSHPVFRVMWFVKNNHQEDWILDPLNDSDPYNTRDVGLYASPSWDTSVWPDRANYWPQADRDIIHGRMLEVQKVQSDKRGYRVPLIDEIG